MCGWLTGVNGRRSGEEWSIEVGSPPAGLATRDNMFDGLALGTMGGTYGAAPLACATANATLDVIQDENLLQNSTDRGRQLVEVRHLIAAIESLLKRA